MEIDFYRTYAKLYQLAGVVNKDGVPPKTVPQVRQGRYNNAGRFCVSPILLK
jgi:hypothetical protein